MSCNHGSVAELAREAIELAGAQKLKIVTAESCTAGALSTVLSGAPGAGQVLQGGFVVYTKPCKTAVLGIPEYVLAKSAVTPEVARAMATGALGACRCADVAISITGVAGPEPDEDGNPVGLAYAAVADRSGMNTTLALDLPTTTGGQLRGEILLRCLELLRDALRLRGPVAAPASQG